MESQVKIEDTVIENSLRHLANLASDVLEQSKRSKIIPPKIREQIIEIDHCATMALMRLLTRVMLDKDSN